MTAIPDRPASRLIRHFFAGLFDLGFLSETGAVSFTRLIIGICATFISFGLLLARVFIKKYAILGGVGSAPEPYRQAVVADHAFLIALPMWIVACATVLVGHALFPDETDFRVLMALPITRRLVFATKLAAVALFAGLFIASAQTALVPLFLVTSWCRWAEGAFVHRAAAYGLATMLASAFTVLAMCALQGVLLLTTRRRALSVSAAWRSLLLCALMLSLPLVGRLPAEASAFAHAAFWLRFSPPAWFAGIEQYLAGHREPHFVQLARIGLVAWLAAAAAAVSSYAWLYRRFDHVMLQSGQPAVRAARSRRAAAHTFRSFAMITLRRSVFHQGVVVVVSAIGLGLVVNSFISSSVLRWLTARGLPPARAIDSVVWAPFALSYVASRAVRAALLIPIEPRANWVFRITERADLRVDQLSAAVQTVRRLGVVAPVAILLPVQFAIAGPAALVASWTALVCGWLHVELLMKDWVRLPFTCSYIPGKRFVPHMIFFGLTMFLGYTTIGAALARRSMASVPAAVIIDVVLILVIAWQRHRRLATWQAVPLEFEDSLPTEVNPLRLSQAD